MFPVTRLLTSLLSFFLALVLGLTVVALPDHSFGLAPQATASLNASGVDHQVTAVLLNFRSYDTWLEVVVLLLAVLAALTLRRSSDVAAVSVMPTAQPALIWLVRVIVPVIVLLSGYLLWLGTHAPGGAFQSGAILAAAGVLMRLAGYRSIAALRGWHLRMSLLAGFAAFLLVGAGTLLRGEFLLQYPGEWAGSIILLIEAAVTVSIAVTLAALFVGASPARDAIQLHGSQAGDDRR